MAPSVYRRGGAGMEIGYTIVDSANTSLGRLLVAATSRGVCAVAMGSSDTELTRALSREYPAAAITTDAGALAQWTTVDSRASVRPEAAARSAARRAGDGVSMAGVAGARGDSVRGDADLLRRRVLDRPAARGARRRARLCHQSGGAGDSVSSRRAGGGRRGRLSLGRGEEESALAGSLEAGRKVREGRRREGRRPSDDRRRPDDRRSACVSRLGRRRDVARGAGIRGSPGAARSRRVRGAGAPVPNGRTIQKPHRHVALPLRRRRVQVLRGAAARHRAGAA